jgi:hypothetical protein
LKAIAATLPATGQARFVESLFQIAA